MAINPEPPEDERRIDGQVVPRLLAGLGVSYWLCALVVNEITLGWFFGDSSTITGDF